MLQDVLYFEGEKIVNKAESEALGTQGKVLLSLIHCSYTDAHMKTLLVFSNDFIQFEFVFFNLNLISSSPNCCILAVDQNFTGQFVPVTQNALLLLLLVICQGSGSVIFALWLLSLSDVFC